jgi:pyruvate, orthophosphate dikinase
MKWIHPLPSTRSAEVLGGKAFGLGVLLSLGLRVPPAFVVSTSACRIFLGTGRFPDGLADELTTALSDLASDVVSVRSGAAVSMPGMMDTALNVSSGVPAAVAEVFSSWNTPRARTYRAVHGIPEDLGTAVIVQRMVFGDRDAHSGSGVAFSRDPSTGRPGLFGEVLPGGQGDAVVSGRGETSPLSCLASLEPEVWAELGTALARIEARYRDACYVEFTYESGVLWFLQVRAGRFVGRAAVRVAVDLVEEGVLSRHEALLRVSAQDLAQARTPRIASNDILARGTGACPGVASGRIATTPDEAVRMASTGPVILVRPETTPLDMHGLAASAGVVTARGGPASHAAVVARSMGKPAVVGVRNLMVDDSARFGGHELSPGTLITIDGTGGEVVLGTPPITAGTDDDHLRRFLSWT